MTRKTEPSAAGRPPQGVGTPASMKTHPPSRSVDLTPDERREALRPIASLIGKSEKALQKLKPGTWQHAMLRDNLAALRLGTALLNAEAGAAAGFARDELQKALRAYASMASRTEKALAKFAPGTSPHSLSRNRLQALRRAEALVAARLDGR